MAFSARGLKGQHWMTNWHMGRLCNGGLRASIAIEALGANTVIDALRDICHHMGAVMVAQDRLELNYKCNEAS